ncbi:hypothetical protein [Stenotrophomonas maltophilia]|uniref:hypothetical protein n=1 Tax=Stenotrophomonas maltophilia TaxID=40324 RepID=UPI000A976881|nr:hypothetical protein [Stenotrophomonas maltophilia]
MTTLRRSLLAISLSSAIAALPAMAAPLIADGNVVIATPDTYDTAGVGEHAFHVLNGGEIDARARGFHLKTAGDGAYGVRVDSGGIATLAGTSEFSRFNIETVGEGATGISLSSGTLDSAAMMMVYTQGRNAHGIQADDADFWVEHSQMITQGEGAHGVLMQGSSTGTLGSIILVTQGNEATGLKVVDSTLNVMGGGRIVTQGERAHGLVIEGTGAVDLQDSTVTATGADAWGAVIEDADRLSLDNASITGNAGGVRVTAGTDSTLALQHRSEISGGATGPAVSVDADVDGRFTVDLDASVLKGDIVYTQTDLDAGRMPLSSVHVALGNGSRWEGTSSIVDTLSMQGSEWALHGDATIKGLHARGNSHLEVQ